MSHTEPRAVPAVRIQPRPRGGRRPVRPGRWALGALALVAATLGRADGPEALARLDPLGAGILPASGFGAAVGYVEAPASAAPGGPADGDGAAEVAVGDLVLVGAPLDGSAGHARGAVHLFLRRAGGFDRARHLLPPTAPSHPAVLSVAEHFGAALATLSPAAEAPPTDADRPGRTGAHGGTLVAVGAPGRDVQRAGTLVPAAGGLSLFRRLPAAGVEGHWQLAAELVAPAPEGGARFGASVALGRSSDRADGRRLAVVGAPGATVSGVFLAGAATVFAEGPVGITGARVWTVEAALVAPRPSVAGSFGASVAIVEDARGIAVGPMATCVAVAAPGDAALGPGGGAVFLFDLDGRLLDVRRASQDVHHGQPHGARYGERIAALGRGRLAIAAPARGMVEVVRIEGGTFVREALMAAHPLFGFGLGLAAAGGDVLAVGAPFEGAGAPGSPLLGAGRVHLFRRTGEVWCAAPRLDDTWPTSLPTTGVEARDELGHAVAFGRGGAALVVAAPASDAACPGGAGCDAGAAFVFATRPRVRSFCAEGAQGALEVLGSLHLADGRLRFVVGGVSPGVQGALHAAARATEPAAPVTGCLVQPLQRLGAAVSDAEGRWQLDAAAQLAALERMSPGTTWAFQVAWRGGGHSSAVVLPLLR